MMFFAITFFIFFTIILNGCEAGGSSTIGLGRSQSMACNKRVIFGKLAPAAAGVAIGADIVELANSTNLFDPATMNPDLENINIIG